MIIQNKKLYIIFLPIIVLLIAVAGCGGGGSGGGNGGDNKQVNGSDSTPPTTPANLQASAISDTQIDLSWDASTDPSTGSGQATGVTGYNIYRCAGSCTPTTFLITSTTNSYSDTGLTADTPYTYTVSAYDASGNESGQSQQTQATTLASAVGNVYYVSPTGTASWAECTDISTPCSLSTANSNVIAGDIVNMRAGTYTTAIQPTNSGSNGNVITYQRYLSEVPAIIKETDFFTAIFLDNVDYIKIDGITVDDSYRWVSIRNGSDYNEITNSTFDDTDGVVPGKGIHIWGQCSGGTPNNCHSTNNWIHNNTIGRSGWVGAAPECQDEGAVMTVGSIVADDRESNYNTIEDNVFFSGGHHLLEVSTRYNVIRNNVFHNEGWMTDPGGCQWGPSPRNGKYGNRNLSINSWSDTTGLFLLVENNRTGHTAFASDGGMDGGITISGRKNIVRYNFVYHTETLGIYFKNGAGDADAMDNRVYNNTIFNSGQDSQIYPDAWTGYGDKDWRIGVYLVSSSLTDNILKNNIVYNSFTEDIYCKTNCQPNNTFTDNWVTADGDPLFINTDVSDPTSTTLPDLRVNSGSGVIDDGVNLTQANGSGSNSTTVIVGDALYFQDGTWGSSLSNIQADWIAIGTVSNTVQISSINYSTNTITLTSPITWSDNANIWLYKNSSGNIVLRGSAPDVGAYEYVN